jgi:hypothetical protein
MFATSSLAVWCIDRWTDRQQAFIDAATRSELVVDGLHVRAGTGFAVNPAASGGAIVTRLSVGGDSLMSFDSTALLLFVRNGPDQQRVFDDWTRRCAARPTMCVLPVAQGTRATCIEISAPFTSRIGDFHVLCRSHDAAYQARFAGTRDAYDAFRHVIDRTFDSR